MNTDTETKKDEQSESDLKLLLGARCKKKALNLNQLRIAAEAKKAYYKDMLSAEIRTIGLRKKIAKRVITLNKVLHVLDEHTE